MNPCSKINIKHGANKNEEWQRKVINWGLWCEWYLFKDGLGAESTSKQTKGGSVEPASKTELAPTFLVRDLGVRFWVEKSGKKSSKKCWNKVLSFGDDGDADDSIVIMFDDFNLDSLLVGSNVEPGEETVVGKTPLIRPVLLPGQINHLRTKWTGRVIMENYLCKLGHLLLLWNLSILSLFGVSLAFSPL